ncbi:MAG: PLDc N-terminal domain-containing protein [Luteolibacter sp.]
MLFPDFEYSTRLGLAALLLFYVVGILHVLHALMHVRTSQGTIAWVISLVTVPFVAIPLYWLLGRTRFSKKIGGRRENDSRLNLLAVAMHERLRR